MVKKVIIIIPLIFVVIIAILVAVNVNKPNHEEVEDLVTTQSTETYELDPNEEDFDDPEQDWRKEWVPEG